MATPIKSTPPVYGKEAISLLKRMNEKPTASEKKLKKKIQKQRKVLF